VTQTHVGVEDPLARHQQPVIVKAGQQLAVVEMSQFQQCGSGEGIGLTQPGQRVLKLMHVAVDGDLRAERDGGAGGKD
jgi:hypothetical protein